jgi:dihydropteroate synthase
MPCYQLTVFSQADLVRELELIACDPAGIAIMQDKLSALTIKITDIPGYCALILKEEALSVGGDCAMPRSTIRQTEKLCDVVLLVTVKQLKLITVKLSGQAFTVLRELSGQLKKFTVEQPRVIPKIMGIINVTPDSFSDGGKFFSVDLAVTQAMKMIEAGALIIDVGGESTRPGAEEISAAEEIKRVVPVIKAIRKKNKKIQISIDTTKSEVARAAVRVGATMINDVSGLTRDPKIARVAAHTDVKLILMHRLAPSKTMQKNPEYKDVLKEILLSLQNSITVAKKAGVKDKSLIIDPGIGFGKTTEHNLYLIKNIKAFKSFGYPVLLGASRKSVIGTILKTGPDDRVEGTIATSLMGLLGQVDFLRVHDVEENLAAVKMWHAFF